MWKQPISRADVDAKLARLSEEDLAAIRARLDKGRLRLALQLAGLTWTQLAEAAGISRSHLVGTASGLQRLSLPMKLRVARVLVVPASALWPELESLALELLHGAAGGKR
jgi:lambda repressor-like predicted transcriptional regulator